MSSCESFYSKIGSDPSKVHDIEPDDVKDIPVQVVKPVQRPVVNHPRGNVKVGNRYPIKQQPPPRQSAPNNNRNIAARNGKPAPFPSNNDKNMSFSFANSIVFGSFGKKFKNLFTISFKF